jgi:hypothetical protein
MAVVFNRVIIKIVLISFPMFAFFSYKDITYKKILRVKIFYTYMMIISLLVLIDSARRFIRSNYYYNLNI